VRVQRLNEEPLCFGDLGGDWGRGCTSTGETQLCLQVLGNRIMAHPGKAQAIRMCSRTHTD
jgi:hypothetical protein